MIVILTGARKNVGDFLIGSRSRKLLAQFVTEEIVELDRFNSIKHSMDVINSSKGLFLCGGPAYTENIYPGIYPLLDDLTEIKVPVIPFGLGWNGKPFGHPEQFQFNQKSSKFLKWVHQRIEVSSCRDEITAEILARHEYNNVVMTGCPVWYDIESINHPFTARSFERIVFTTPASRMLIKQNRTLMSELRARFPAAEVVCSFHRGIRPDKNTGLRHGWAYMQMAKDARALGFKVVDASYSLSNIGFYRDFDFHVGYRVHAHLDFLSRRKASILINEDGRGQGMNRTLTLPELNHNAPDLLSKYRSLLQRYSNQELADFSRSSQIIDNRFKQMRDFLLKCA